MALLHFPKPLPIVSPYSPSDGYFDAKRDNDRRKQSFPVAVERRRALRRREDIEKA